MREATATKVSKKGIIGISQTPPTTINSSSNITAPAAGSDIANSSSSSSSGVVVAENEVQQPEWLNDTYTGIAYDKNIGKFV